MDNDDAQRQPPSESSESVLAGEPGTANSTRRLRRSVSGGDDHPGFCCSHCDEKVNRVSDGLSDV